MTGSELERVEPSQELVVVDQAASVQLAPIENPAAFVAGYVAVANELARVIQKQQLFSQIQGRSHVKVEGWTLLGSMLGVFPICEWTRQVYDASGEAIGWEARVEARTRDGHLVGAAEAECLRTEAQWSWEPKSRSGAALQPRDDFALRSMAQTRATSKALRAPLGFVISLAGYDPTPAEEMPAAPPRQQLPSPPRDEPAATSETSGPISDAQRRRLFAIANTAKVDEEKIRDIVESVTGDRSTASIQRGQYEQVCELVEAAGVPF